MTRCHVFVFLLCSRHTGTIPVLIQTYRIFVECKQSNPHRFSVVIIPVFCGCLRNLCLTLTLVFSLSSFSPLVCEPSESDPWTREERATDKMTERDGELFELLGVGQDYPISTLFCFERKFVGGRVHGTFGILN